MSTKTEHWNATNRILPERGQRVDWLQGDGEIVQGGTHQGVWLLPDGMYVYYTPQFWRPNEEAE